VGRGFGDESDAGDDRGSGGTDGNRRTPDENAAADEVAGDSTDDAREREVEVVG
jgi:hypothetical protein